MDERMDQPTGQVVVAYAQLKRHIATYRDKPLSPSPLTFSHQKDYEIHFHKFIPYIVHVLAIVAKTMSLRVAPSDKSLLLRSSAMD